MLLAVDIGNTSTHFGLFKGKKLTRQWRVATNKLSSFRLTGNYEKVIVSSVVPKVNKYIKRYFPTAIFVTRKNVGLKLKVRKPDEIGADRLVDAQAASILYGCPVIVVDFGTATTFDVVNAKGEYLGGAIAPGISLSRDILHERTAKLPRIEIKAPKDIIGRSTVEAMQSGLVIGYVVLVEGMCQLLKIKLKEPGTRVIATGGLAGLICKYTTVVDKIDQALTLKGLRLIGEGHV